MSNGGNSDDNMITIDKRFLTALLGDHVKYYPVLSTLLGRKDPKAALWLSNVLRWTGLGWTEDWVWKTQAEFQVETGMSRAMQDTAREKWEKAGVIEHCRMGKDGTSHYRVNMEKLSEMVVEAFDLGETVVCENLTNRFAGMSQTGLRECRKPLLYNKTYNNNNNSANGKEPGNTDVVPDDVCDDCGTTKMLTDEVATGEVLCAHCRVLRMWYLCVEGAQDGKEPENATKVAPQIGTKSHREEIRKRIKDDPDWIDTVRRALIIAMNSPLLREEEERNGFTGRWFTFGWLLRKGNAQKIIDNQRNYVNPTTQNRIIG